MDNFDLRKYLAENRLNETSNPNPSAVEWLCENNYTFRRELELGNQSLIKQIKQAKEMEIENIKNAFDYGQTDLGMEADEYLNFINFK
jgi:hypothetical protein